jgi:hypothetical protein
VLYRLAKSNLESPRGFAYNECLFFTPPSALRLPPSSLRLPLSQPGQIAAVKLVPDRVYCCRNALEHSENGPVMRTPFVTDLSPCCHAWRNSVRGWIANPTRQRGAANPPTRPQHHLQTPAISSGGGTVRCAASLHRSETGARCPSTRSRRSRSPSSRG